MKALKPVKFNTPVTGQFIRGSTATYIEDGILKTAAINEPRWQDGKLFLEGEATNLLNRSSEFSDAVWGKTATVTANTVVAPDGSIFADTLEDTSTSSSQDVSRIVSVGGGVHTFSVWLRASSPCTSRIAVRDGGGDITSKDVSVTTEWGRFSVSTANPSASAGSGAVWIYVRANNNETGLLYAWGAQLEQSSSATSYIPTTTTPVTRSADICIGNFSRASTATYVDSSGIVQTAPVNTPRIQNNKLLVEPVSTNLATWSEGFTTSWSVFNATTSTVTTSPTGANTARQLNETATTASHGTSQTVTVNGASKTFTASIFAKARTRTNFHFELGQLSGGKCVINTNLSTGVQTKVQSGFDGETYGIQFIGNGWYRIWITAKLVSFNSPYVQLTLSTDGVTTNYTGVAGNGIDIFGGQLEESTFVTSYIPTTTVAVTRSADLHTAGIVYSNAVESTASWSSATTYSVGQKVRYNNTIYESLQGTNLNKQPDTNPTWWLSLGADNITAAIDGKVGTKTVATDKLRMIVYPDSAIDAVGYIECSANSISTSAVDTDYNVVYSYKTGLSNESIDNWYDYFFIDPLGDPFTQVVHQGVNSLDSKLVVGVEMTRSGSVELGLIVAGQTTEIGKTQYGLKAGIVDYSKKQADEFGNVVLVERTYSKRLEGDVYVYNYDLNKVQRFLYNIRATPVLWIASDNPELAEVSNVYGFYKDFSTTIAYPDVSMCSLQIEGLT